MLDANGLEAAAKATFAKANEGNLKPETIESLWPSQHLPHWSGLAEAAITAYLQAVGPEPATWEYFCDRSYFDMWCVRQKDAPKVFGDGYHVMSEAEAKSLAAYLNSALVATPPAEPTPGQFAERVIAACRGYMNTYDVLAKEIRENMQFCMAEALRAADAVTNPVNTSTELTVLKADIDEFMRRLGPRWFLEQGWFPETVNATLASLREADHAS